MKSCLICSFQLKEFDKNFYKKCKNCKTVFYLKAKNIDYNEQYFLEEYQKQYGKNYFEDKLKLQQKMEWRMKKFFQSTNIYKQFSNKKIHLLEVGSAAGFFLELMPKYNITAEGWEFSKFMSNYAQKKGFNSTSGDFFSIYDPNKHKQKFHIISTFYCIEHIPNQKNLWESFYNILKPNGYLLVSVPSYFGPLFYFHYNTWKNLHPIDHFVDYSPYSFQKLASHFHFRFIKAFSEGIHPERFPFGKNKLFQLLYSFLQRKTYFSDTIFVILQKKS